MVCRLDLLLQGQKVQLATPIDSRLDAILYHTPDTSTAQYYEFNPLFPNNTRIAEKCADAFPSLFTKMNRKSVSPNFENNKEVFTYSTQPYLSVRSLLAIWILSRTSV